MGVDAPRGRRGKGKGSGKGVEITFPGSDLRPGVLGVGLALKRDPFQSAGGGRNQAEEPTSSSIRLSLEHIRADIQTCTRCAPTGRGTNPGHGHAPRGWVRTPPPLSSPPSLRPSS